MNIEIEGGVERELSFVLVFSPVVEQFGFLVHWGNCVCRKISEKCDSDDFVLSFELFLIAPIRRTTI